jgi:hypothetical protein
MGNFLKVSMGAAGMPQVLQKTLSTMLTPSKMHGARDSKRVARAKKIGGPVRGTADRLAQISGFGEGISLS